MTEQFYAFLYLLWSLFEQRQKVRERFLEAQVKISMTRDKKQHYKLSPEERRWLLSIGAEINHDVKDIMIILTWDTYRRWLRDQAAGKEAQQVGRKRSITQDIRDLIVRLAIENPQWGKLRILGELKKLAIHIATCSVQRILREEGIPPTPDKDKRRSPPVSWWTMVKGHIDCVVATDFFTKPVWTLRGKVDAYCLFFIHLGTRKVFCSPVTINPDEKWVMQQARNAAMWLEDEGLGFRFLIHDRERRVAADSNAA